MKIIALVSICFWGCIGVFSILLISNGYLKSTVFSPTSLPFAPKDADYSKGVCSTVIIRLCQDLNDILPNCRIIEGSLQISLPRCDEICNDTFVFPQLIEIRDYVFIYSKTCAVNIVFPNLALIRGDKVKDDYSLIVRFQDAPISQIFPKLSLILNGFAYDLAEEEKLAKSFCSSSGDQVRCNLTTESSTSHSWKNNVEESACHSSCLAGCYSPHSKDHCVACRFLRDGKRCVEKCSHDRFQHRGSCVDEDFCKKNYFVVDKNSPKKCWERNETCDEYSDEETCKKQCHGGPIKSIEALQKIENCKVIGTNLIIKLRIKDDTGYYLEKYLSNIIEIGGYLSISSAGINNLKFLTNLKSIGNLTQEGNRSLIIENCQDLTSIEPFESKQILSVLNGGVFFGNNKKLCKPRIIGFVQRNGLNVGGSILSNGNSPYCDEIVINVTGTPIPESSSINVEWNEVQGYSHPYTVMYKIIPTNASKNDMPKLSGFSPLEVYGNVTALKLKPCQQYALYVKGFAPRNSVRNDIRSDVIYIKTGTGSRPLSPRNVTIEVQTSSSLLLTWKPSGDAACFESTNYTVLVRATKERSINTLITNSNYCKLKDKYSHTKKIIRSAETAESYDQLNIDETLFGDSSMPNYFKEEKINIIRYQDLQKSECIVSKTGSCVITNLKADTQYSVEVTACHTTECSLPAKTLRKTNPNENQIYNITRTFSSDLQHVNYTWNVHQNGSSSIIGYELRIGEDVYGCISASDFKQLKKLSLKMSPIYGEHLAEITIRTINGVFIKKIMFSVPPNRNSQNVNYLKYIFLLIATIVIILIIVKGPGLLSSVYNKKFLYFGQAERLSPIYSFDQLTSVSLLFDRYGSTGKTTRRIITAELNGKNVIAKFPGNSQQYNAMINEATVLRGLQHTSLGCKSIITYIGFLDSYKQYGAGTILENMELGNLKDYLSNSNRLNEHGEETYLNIMFQWAEEMSAALTYLKDNDIVHRQVSIASCLLYGKGSKLHIKLSKFSLAIDTRVYLKKCKILPQMKAIIFSLGFLRCIWNRANYSCPSIYLIPPEIFRGNKNYPSSDIWGFGVFLWELLSCGQMEPYQGETEDYVSEQIKGGANVLMWKDYKHFMDYKNYNDFHDNIKDLMKCCFQEQQRRIKDVAETLRTIKISLPADDHSGKSTVQYHSNSHDNNYSNAYSFTIGTGRQQTPGYIAMSMRPMSESYVPMHSSNSAELSAQREPLL